MLEASSNYQLPTPPQLCTVHITYNLNAVVVIKIYINFRVIENAVTKHSEEKLQRTRSREGILSQELNTTPPYPGQAG